MAVSIPVSSLLAPPLPAPLGAPGLLSHRDDIYCVRSSFPTMEPLPVGTTVMYDSEPSKLKPGQLVARNVTP
eukprot:gene49475-27327_t